MVQSDLYVVSAAEPNSVTNDLRAIDNVDRVSVLYVDDFALYFSSLKELTGQKVSILSYIDPLVAIIVSYFLLFENITFDQIIGGSLIICFTLINEITLKKALDKIKQPDPWKSFFNKKRKVIP